MKSINDIKAKGSTAASTLERVVPSVYRVLDITDNALPRLWALITRKKYEARHFSSRAQAYKRAFQEYDNLVPNEDMINIAEVEPGEPLFYVKPEDHEELARLGAKLVKDKWLMPEGLDDAETWKFIKWFPRAAPDLRVEGSNTLVRPDGRSTMGYIASEDKIQGGDSSATSIVMGMFPIFSALLLAALTLLPFDGVYGVIGYSAVAVIGAALLLMSNTILESEGFGTLVKLVLLGVVIPLSLGLHMVSEMLSGRAVSSGGLYTWLALGAAAMVFVVASMSPTKNDQKNLISKGTKFKFAVSVVAVAATVNWLTLQLPDSLGAIRLIGVFLIPCCYALIYTRENAYARAEFLKDLSMLLGGQTKGRSSLIGPLAPQRKSQIRSAARDTSTFMPEGIATGTIYDTGLCIGPQQGKPMGGTRDDGAKHWLILGKTGKGKTAMNLRRKLLNIAMDTELSGVIAMDGKGALINDTRSYWDIIVEPGVLFAPFQGLDSAGVSQAFDEASSGDMEGSGAIWRGAAGDFRRYGLAVLEGLIVVYRQREDDAVEKLKQYKLEINSFLAQRELLRRDGKDTSSLSKAIEDIQKNAYALIDFLKEECPYRWTPDGYSRLRTVLSAPVDHNGVRIPNDKALALFEFLGVDISGFKQLGQPNTDIKVDQSRYDSEPASVHPHLLDDSRVLVQSLMYFCKDIPALPPETLGSVMFNVNKEIQGFLQSDKLRGSMIDGVDHGERAWADTEIGVDILQCMYGKKVGINISAEGTTEKIIIKLIEMRVDKAMRTMRKDIDPKVYNSWREKCPDQTPVYKVVDEAQDIVSPMDEKMVAIGRSLGYWMVMSTQSIDVLARSLKLNDTGLTSFLNNFLNYTMFACSRFTYEYIQKMVGEATKRKVPVAMEASVDYERGLEMYERSVFRDPTHPYASIYQDLDRRGGARIQITRRGMKGFNGLARKVPINEMEERNYFSIEAGAEYVKEFILDMAQMTENLQMEGRALMIVDRAGHPWMDFVKLEYISTTDFDQEIERIRQDKALKAAQAEVAKLAETTTSN